jgi:hypothetical protein
MSMHPVSSTSALVLVGLLGTQALAQNAKIDTFHLVRRDGSHVVTTGIFNGIDAQFITLGRWRIPRSHVRFLCLGACPTELPTEPAAQDTVVWKTGEKTTGPVVASGEFDQARASDLRVQNGTGRNWRDARYVQFAEPEAAAAGARSKEPKEPNRPPQ